MEFNAKYRSERPAFVAREHTCRNFEKILDWAHQYPSNETLFVLPDGTVGDESCILMETLAVDLGAVIKPPIMLIKAQVQ